MSRESLWIPGPTEVDAGNLQAMATPVIGHRSPAIRELIGSIKPGLRELLGTEEVGVMTSSATTVMEAGIRNLVEERVLVAACGAFGKRWHGIAESNGIASELDLVEPGEPVLPEVVAERMASGGFDALCLTHNETATAVLNPVAEIIAAVRAVTPDVTILVDAVSSLSAVELYLDDIDADLILAGVQKAMALPPGLAVYGLSQRALDKAARVPHRGFTTDFLRIRESWEKDQTPATPSCSHLFALQRQLGRIHEEGLPARAARHRAMADRVAAWAAERGHAMLAREGYRSPTVSCLKAEGREPSAIIEGVLERCGARLGGGYGDFKPTHYRIGHMGEHTPDELNAVLAAIDATLA